MGVVQDLQRLTDVNKQKSIQEFFAKQQDATMQDESEESSEFGFQGRYGGIHYPSFFPQIPVPILADLVNLVVDSQALELGSWLLYSEDLDGPLIHKGLYSDPIMGPPLIRLAASLADEVLMAQILKIHQGNSQVDPPEEVLNEILDQQIEAGNWPFVDRALESFARLPGYSISTNTTATMIGVILREAKSTDNLSALQNTQSAKVFQKMSSFRTTGDFRGKRGYEKHDIFELGSRVWRLLALINDSWSKYAWKVYPNMTGYNHIKFTPKAFNKILSGVVDTYGSATGKRYFGKFWPDSLEDEPSRTLRSNNNPGGIPRMAASRQDTSVLTSPYADKVRAEHRIRIQGPGGKVATIIVSAQSKLNLTTIHIILKKALEEADGQDTLIHQEANWARRIMKKMGLPDSNIRKELRGVPELANYIEDDLEDLSDGEVGKPSNHDLLNDGPEDKAQLEDEY